MKLNRRHFLVSSAALASGLIAKPRSDTYTTIKPITYPITYGARVVLVKPGCTDIDSSDGPVIVELPERPRDGAQFVIMKVSSDENSVFIRPGVSRLETYRASVWIVYHNHHLLRVNEREEYLVPKMPKSEFSEFPQITHDEWFQEYLWKYV